MTGNREPPHSGAFQKVDFLERCFCHSFLPPLVRHIQRKSSWSPAARSRPLLLAPFWSGASSKDGVSRTYMNRLSRIFALAGIKGGHAHRFRDTFAVELLLAGEPLERVSILLGHTRIKVPEKHYSPWVKARQEQLEAGVAKSWERDPIAQREMKRRLVAVVVPLNKRA